jgi:hypothetical protein
LNSLLTGARTGSSTLVFYTSFGVVRGKPAASLARLSRQDEVAAAFEVIELTGASIEHYSSHLPTASFDRFFVRLSDVLGIASDEDLRQT